MRKSTGVRIRESHGGRKRRGRAASGSREEAPRGRSQGLADPSREPVQALFSAHWPASRHS